MPDSLDIGLGILVVGLIIGLPNFSTILIDFTQLSSTAITMMRIGLMAIFVYFVTGGRK